jgi:FkbM family methyltransferase
VELTVDDELGTVAFTCEDDPVSAWVCNDILRDFTYPHLPFLDDVRVVLDLGANCGAAAVHLARHHPGAVVHAVEPAAAPRAVLEVNAARHPAIRVHPVALHDHDGEAWLHHSEVSIMSSLRESAQASGTSEPVTVRRASAWAREQGIGRIDVLKLDVEGSELAVLTDLADWLPTIQAIYVEYDDRASRRGIEDLLAPTHHLWYSGMMLLDQGECVYLSHAAADLPGGRDRQAALLARLFRERRHD